MRPTLLLIPAAAVIAACANDTLPTQPVADPTLPALEAAAQANAAIYWNAVARNLVAKHGQSAPFAIRGYAQVAVAQHNAAAKAAERSVHAAISAASVVTLSYLFPSEQSALETQLQQYLAGSGNSGDVREGEVIGRNVGAQQVAYAQGDRFFAPWNGTIPVGPGIWFSNTPPGGPGFGQAKTFLLLSGSQFRPAPHPAFNSPAFLEAVAEVRRYSDNRTREQDSLAKFWHLPAGTYQPPGYWNEEGARLATKYRLTERRTAHLFALLNIVSYDAIVASHEAKYHYWLLRPSQADPNITLSVGLPNFPAYPSNHASISAAMAAVLGATFPAERFRLADLADQAAMSRVYGGIHYRFDGTAGLVLGRRIADWALDHNVGLREQFQLK
jgi:hypothetical protein